MTSRRNFLQQVSATAAGVSLLSRRQTRQLWALPALEFLPEPDEAFMRELALTAMEAARAAGADFADLRLIVARSVALSGVFSRSRGDRPEMGWPSLTLTAGYGIRAIVNGAWGFASGSELTPDAVANAARGAVMDARINRPRHPRILDLVPIPPVEHGVWATPMARDPLTVPLGEQRDLALAALAEAVPGPAIASARLAFQWRRPTAVFAATDGTFLLQRLATAIPSGSVLARVGKDIWSLAVVKVGGLRMGGYGYEAVETATLGTEVRRAGERATALAQAARAPTSVEVGRYDLVFGARSVRELLAGMAGAVDLERTLGYRANSAGTSFAAPPADILGRYQVASPLVTVHADRAQPGGAATVGWDEEGVKPENYTFIRDGVIVDYHTNRQTATELAGWYHAQGQSVRAHGCTRRTGDQLPAIILPNLTMEPGRGSTTLDDLIAGTTRGFYIEEASAMSDQQMLSTQGGAEHIAVRQIRNGKLGEYVRDFAFQYITPDFWRNVDGLGGVTSAESGVVLTDMAALYDPLQPFPHSTLRAVPMRVRQVNVLNTGRTG